MTPVLIAVGIHQLLYAIPLIVVVSLVYAATRHEQMVPIVKHSVRFGVWVAAFMAIILAVLKVMDSFAG